MLFVTVNVATQAVVVKNVHQVIQAIRLMLNRVVKRHNLTAIHMVLNQLDSMADVVAKKVSKVVIVINVLPVPFICTKVDVSSVSVMAFQDLAQAAVYTEIVLLASSLADDHVSQLYPVLITQEKSLLMFLLKDVRSSLESLVAAMILITGVYQQSFWATN